LDQWFGGWDGEGELICKGRNDGAWPRVSDLPPSKEDGMRMSKRIAWVLNAEQVRSDFHERKRKREEEEAKQNKKRRKDGSKRETTENTIRIMPGESMTLFNRRVDDRHRERMDLAMRSARKSSKTRAKSTSEMPARSKQTASAGQPSEVPAVSPTRQTKTEFDKREDRRSVNDVATAPPILNKSKLKNASPAGNYMDVVPMAQRRMIEEERERVIARYRALKQEKMMK